MGKTKDMPLSLERAKCIKLLSQLTLMNKKALWLGIAAVYTIIVFWIDIDFFLKFLLLSINLVFLVNAGIIPWENNNRGAALIGLRIILLPLAFAVYFCWNTKYSPYTFIFVLAILVVLFLHYRLNKQIKRIQEEEDQRARDRRSQDYGSAGYTPEEEFQEANGSGSPALWLGANFFRSKPEGHLITCAPPGSGKGACLIIPNLLMVPTGSNVITDPKGENAFITARAQKEYKQKVYIIDPWENQKQLGAIHGIESSGFNPFDVIRSFDKEEWPDICQMIANILLPENPQAKDPYWDKRGRSLIKLLLLQIMTTKPLEEQTFWTLYLMLRAGEPEFLGYLYDMKKNPAFDGLMVAGANEVEGLMGAENTFRGILSHAHDATAIFESSKLRASLAKSEFNPYDLANGDVTVYVVIPEKYLESHSAYLKIVLSLMLKAVNDKPGKRVNFFIDEAGLIGKIDELQRVYAFGRGQKIIIWQFYQSVAQIRKIYGQDGLDNFMGMTAVKQFIHQSDPFSAEYVSKLLGKTTRVKWREPSSENQSGTWESFEYNLLNPDEIAQNDGIITLAEGKKIIMARDMYWNGEGEVYDLFREYADPPPRVNT